MLSRAEVELLIKARNDAGAAFDSLNKQIGRVAGETDRADRGMGKFEKSTKSTGVAAGAAGVAVGLLADRLARGLVSGFNQTIQAANRADAAFGGLEAVAKGFGVSADAAKKAAQDFASNGLASVSESATALKNLLSVGYGLEESIQIMQAHADAAAYNRQGMLGFGESIVRVTDGLKFNNSTLTDSTGLGKNLSAIMKDAGLSQDAFGNAVNDASARQAYLNETLKASALFHGNAAKYADTAAGAQAAFGAAAEETSAKIGKALQPALASVLEAATPFVKVIGDMAPILVPLAGAVAAVVTPLVAMRAAAALGVPSLSGLTKSADGLVSTFSKVQSSAFGGFVPALRTVGEQAGITTASLGKMRTGLALLEAAAVGFAVGSVVNKIINQFVDLDGAVERATLSFSRWIRSTTVGGQIEAAGKIAEQQRIVNLAVQAGADATISYTDALKYMAQVNAIRRAETDKSTRAQLLAAEAELALGRVTQDEGRRRVESLQQQQRAHDMAADADRRAQQVAQNRVSLTDAIRVAEKQVRDEIAATGLSIGQLITAMQQNEAGFKKWADAMKLSDETLDFLEGWIKANEEAQRRQQKATEDAARAADEAAKAQQELRDELEGMGIVTERQANVALERLAELEKQAVGEGVPLNNFLVATIPVLEELAAQLKLSGVEVDGVTAAMERAHAAFRATIPSLSSLVKGLDFAPLGEPVKLMTGLQTEAYLAGKAMKAFGLTSQTELRRAATEATTNYERIVRFYGEKSPEAVAAHREMVETIKKLSGDVPTYWEREVFPGIVNVVKNISTAVEGSFAQMLLGAKGFKDGFVDIWKSIKAGVLNILNEILSSFVNSFLKGLIGAMSGQQGAFGKAFAGIIGGGGGGGLGGGFSLAGLFGGGGAGATGTFGGLPVGSLGSSGGAAAAGGGSSLLGIAGGAGAGALAGFGLGNRFGTKAGIGGGIASGAATGAIFGGPLGAGIGAGVGLIAGIIGGAQNNTKKQREAFAAELGYGSMDELFAALNEKAPDQAGELRNRALNVIGKKDTKGNEKWMEDVVAAFEKAEQKLSALADATNRWNLSWEDMNKTVQQTKFNEIGAQMLADQKMLVDEGYRYEAVLAKQAEGYSGLVAKSKELGLELPAALQPVLLQLAEMGLLVDDNGEKINDLTGIMFAAGKEQESNAKSLGERLAEYQQRLTEVVDAQAKAQTEIEKNKLENQARQLEEFINDTQRQLDQAPLTIPVTYTYQGDPTAGASPNPQYDAPVEGGAADGVMANRPGLVLFGEGGEPEVGGPARFFERIFSNLGIGQNAGTMQVNVVLENGTRLGRALVPLIAQGARSHGVVRRR